MDKRCSQCKKRKGGWCETHQSGVLSNTIEKADKKDCFVMKAINE